MAETIKISDGVTTIDFLGSNYKILTGGGWAPRRAQRRLGEMGGRSPYQDVAETMAIQVKGSSAADCLGKLNDLSDLLDQAQAWSQDDAGVTAVYLEYEPDGSEVSSVKAVITGPPSSGDFLTMPQDFTFINKNNRYLLGTNNDPIILSFTRLGLLLGATEVETSVTSTGNPAILTASVFTESPKVLTPYDAFIEFSASPVPDFVFMATANSADKLLIIEGEDFGTHNNMTDTAVAGSSGGNVVRTNTGVSTFTMQEQMSTFNSDVRLMAVYGVLKNNSATISYTITPKFVEDGPTITIAAGDTDIQLVKFGEFATPATFDAIWPLELRILADASVTTSNTLDIDYVLVIGLDESTHITKFIFDSNFNVRLNAEHRLDTNKNHRVYSSSAAPAITHYPSFEGAATLTSSGNSISAMVWGLSTSDWLIEDAGNSELNVNLTVTRTDAYLTPPGAWSGNAVATDYVTVTDSATVTVTGP